MLVKKCLASEIPLDWYGELIGLDIETEDLPIDSPICLVSVFNPKKFESLVIVIKGYSKGKLVTISDSDLETFKIFLSSIRSVGHYLQFDLSRILYHWGVAVKPAFDTFLFSRMLQFKEQALKDIIMRLKPEMMTYISKFSKVMPGKPPFYYNIDDINIIIYSGLDAYMPFVIMDKYRNSMNKLKKIIKIEMDYLEIAYKLQAKGMLFSEQVYYETQREFSNYVELNQKKLDAIAGFHCRTNSSADLLKFLVDDLGMYSSITTPKGAISTNGESLDQMMDNEQSPTKREYLQLVMDLKHDFSVQNTSKKLINFVANDGRVHPTIEQIGFDGTARVYSRDPSLNQLPKEMRRALIPSPGKKFVMGDWSGAEFYIAVYWSKCAKAIKWFEDKVDIHTEISKILLNKTEVSKEDREISKVLTFATIFGSEGAAISRKLNISMSEAVELKQAYDALFPEIGVLRAKIINYAHKNVYTKTMFGRPRMLPDINHYNKYISEACERQAFNTAIQATCADFFKIAAYRADNNYKDLGVEYVFGVFDSTLIEVPIDMDRETYTKIFSEISDFSDLFPDFKFRFKVEEGMNWKEVQDKL